MSKHVYALIGSMFVLMLILGLTMIARADPLPATSNAVTMAQPNVSAWTSGWMDKAIGASGYSHNLGGDPSSYSVDLWFRDTAVGGGGINQRYFGGNAIGSLHYGAFWDSLTDTSINVQRWTEDDAVNQIYLRVWQPDPPDWDSGWQDIAAGQAITLTHNLGGNVDDYIVGIKFKDYTLGPNSINQRYFGGVEDSGPVAGAAWFNLTNTSIQVARFAQDGTAAQVRVTVTRPTAAPAYDSGWTIIGQGATHGFTHNLGGNVNNYLVRYSTRSSVYGINTVSIGGKENSGNNLGSYWENLTASSINVHRESNDISAQEVRVRIFLPGYNLYLPLILK